MAIRKLTLLELVYVDLLRTQRQLRLTGREPMGFYRTDRLTTEAFRRLKESATNCAWCGAPLIPVRRDQRTCSRHCRDNLRQQEYRAHRRAMAAAAT